MSKRPRGASEVGRGAEIRAELEAAQGNAGGAGEAEVLIGHPGSCHSRAAAEGEPCWLRRHGRGPLGKELVPSDLAPWGLLLWPRAVRGPTGTLGHAGHVDT